MTHPWRPTKHLIAALVIALLPAAPAAAQWESAELSRLLDLAAENGEVPVLVRLAVDFQPEGHFTFPYMASLQRRNIQRAQDRVLKALEKHAYSSLSSFETVPYLGMVVDQATLLTLSSHPDVETS